MNKKRISNVLFVLFWIIFTITIIRTPYFNAEDIPNPDSSAPSIQNQTQTETNNKPSQPATENSQEVPPSETQEVKPETPPAPEKPKKKTVKKAKKVAPPAEKKAEEPPKTETPPVSDTPPASVRVTLPDISDNNYAENDIIVPSQAKNPQEKLIKGIIAWAMILSGLALIIWVIINNRKIPKYSNKILNGRKSSKILRKRRIYYKKSNRK